MKHNEEDYFLEYLKIFKMLDSYQRFADYKDYPIQVGEILYYYREKWSELGAIPYKVFKIEQYKNGFYSIYLEMVDNPSDKLSVKIEDAFLSLYRTNPIK